MEPSARASLDLTYSRQQALQEFDQSAALVRNAMNAEPSKVDSLLGQRLTGPIGNDPRVLALCREIIQKSNSPISATAATYGVRSVLESQSIFCNESCTFRHTKLFKDAVSVLQEAGKHSNARVRLAEASLLGWVGGKHRDEALEIFHGALAQTSDQLAAYEAVLPTFDGLPEMIDFLGKTVEKGSDQETTQRALSDLRSMALRHATGLFKGGERARITDVFLKALNSRYDSVQLDAAYYLSEMSGRQRKLAREFIEQRLRQPIAPEAHGTAIHRIILPLLDSTDPKDVLLVRDATKTNDLLTSYQKEIESMSPAERPFNAGRLSRWKALL